MTIKGNNIAEKDTTNALWEQHKDALTGIKSPDEVLSNKNALVSNLLANPNHSDSFLDELFSIEYKEHKTGNEIKKIKKNEGDKTLKKTGLLDSKSVEMLESYSETDTTKHTNESFVSENTKDAEILANQSISSESDNIKKEQKKKKKKKLSNTKDQSDILKKKKEKKKKKMRKEEKAGTASQNKPDNFMEWLSLQKPLKESMISKKQKKKKKKKLSEAERLAAESLKMSDTVVSESYANLLAKQGYKEQAIEMYKKLILKNPEKSSYFAAEIQKLNQNN